MVGSYSANESSHAIFNLTSGSFIGTLNGKFKKIKHSSIFNRIYYIDDLDQLKYVNRANIFTISRSVLLHSINNGNQTFKY